MLNLFSNKRIFYNLANLAMLGVLVGCLDQTGTSGTDAGTAAEIIPPTTGASASTVVCNALASPTSVSTNANAGLIANLYYLDDSMPRYTSVNDYINNGVAVSNISLLFTQVNIPTRNFDLGFTTGAGQTITNMDGNTLYEYFAIKFQGDIVLSSTDAPGDYQFAVISDDGSVLANRNADGSAGSAIVNNDGTHPSLMGCSTAPITMTSSSRLPIDYRYYQGPRYQIAAVIMWRPWPTDPTKVLDPECGQEGNYYFFDPDNNSAPTANYAALLARGWTVVGVNNYMLPQGIQNSCNVPAPTITNLAATPDSATSATVTWTTDVSSTSQVQVINDVTNATSTTAVDTTMTTSHSVTLTGLTASTLYTVTPVSASISGLSTTGTSTAFRTPRN